MLFNKNAITTEWFFSDPPFFLKYLGIYVKGDALVMVPLLVGIGVLAMFSLKLGALAATVLYIVRGFGEMIYWFFQQFGPKTYRPGDYGLKKLNNDGVYIIYQLTSMVQVVVGFTLLFAILR